MPERVQERALLAFAGGTFHTALFIGAVVLLYYRGGGLAGVLADRGTGLLVFAGAWLGITGFTALGLNWLGWPILEARVERARMLLVGTALGALFGAIFASIVFFPFVIVALPALVVGSVVGMAIALVDVAVITPTVWAFNSRRRVHGDAARPS